MSLRVRMAMAACALVGGLAACGGNSQPNTTPPAPTVTDPCATASIEEAVQAGREPLALAAQTAKIQAVDGNPRWRVFDALWSHQAASDRPSLRTFTPAPASADVGDIAVIQDEGDLVLPANALDLKGLGLRFTRNAAGGYDVTRIDGAFRATLGTRLTLTDDDGVGVNVPFGFSFYGRTQTAAFVNSDGNVTFEEADRSSTERNVARLLTGPPRVSPFLADLDPSTGGRIFVNAAADQYTVTWCNVRGFDSTLVVSAQATLLPSGNVEVKYGSATSLASAVVGLSPGHTTVFAPVNLSDAGPSAGGAGAVGERFAQKPELDTVAVTRKFYSTHADSFDQLVIWSDATLVPDDAFAYEFTVANEVRGIGQDVYDLSRDFGSGGRLRSVAVMDFLGKYPDDPLQKFLGENNTVSVLGQEVGHRWLAFIDIRDRTGDRSDVLLGRDLAHWSFFFDSDASVMEGNDIEDLGGGSFRTVAAVQRYSLLDQYAMGLVPDTAVPTFFYVENPVNLSLARTRESAPLAGVTFNGTRRDVVIQDVIAINGPRQPTAAQSSRIHRQAFVYIVGAGRTADSGQVAKLDLIRRQWEAFFLRATDNRMRADTALR